MLRRRLTRDRRKQRSYQWMQSKLYLSKASAVLVKAWSMTMVRTMLQTGDESMVPKQQTRVCGLTRRSVPSTH